MKIKQLLYRVYKKFSNKYPNIHSTAYIARDASIVSPTHIYMEEHTNINGRAVIMNGKEGKFIMKKYSGAAIGLTALCGNHMSVVGKWMKEITDKEKRILDTNHEYSNDIIVDEDVWIGANVTLLSGTHVGRSCTIGAGSIVRGIVPPYSVVVGNPAKVVGFKFIPEEIIEHEKALYPEEERLPLDLLEKNYKKYFLDHIKEIKAYTGLICK